MPSLPPLVTDRLRGAFLSMVRAVAPQLLYLGVYEYRVVTTQAPVVPGDQTWSISGVPADAALLPLLPPLAGISMWPGPVWGYSVPSPGSVVRIGFVNADPSKPYVQGLGPTAPPISVVLGSPAATPVALAVPLAAAVAAASASAESAAQAGDGGVAAFTAFAASMTIAVAAYTAKIVKAT